MMANMLGQIVQYSDSSEAGSDDDDERSDSKGDNKQKSDAVPSTGSNIETRNSPEPKKRRLELPPALLSMFKSSPSHTVKDDPNQHQGRKRSFAHVRGNWATHVYFPVEKTVMMCNMIAELISIIPNSTDWHQMESLHVSVSKTVVVRHHWIDQLRTDLTEALQDLKTFHCELHSVELYANEEKTRTFLGLRVGPGVHELQQVVERIDGAFKEFQLETYYKDPSFHVSVAWTLGNVTPKVSGLQKEKLQRVLRDTLEYNSLVGIVSTDHLEAKCGNKIFSFPLKPQR